MMEQGPLTWAMVKGYDYFSDRGEAVAATLEHVTEEQQAATAAHRAGSDVVRQTTRDIELMAQALGYDTGSLEADILAQERSAARAKRLAEAKREAAQAARDEEAATRAAAKARNQNAAATQAAIDQLDKMVAAEQATAQAADEAWAASLDGVREGWAGVADAAEDAELRITESFQAWTRQVVDDASNMVMTAAETVAGFAALATEATVEQMARSKAARQTEREAFSEQLEAEREAIQVRLERGEVSKAVADQELANIDQRSAEEAQAAHRARVAEKQAVAKSFKASQATARIEATLKSAQAYMGLLAHFAYLGPAAPGAAAAITVPSLALQMATINKQSPPEFPMGRSPDHPIVGAIRPDEAILSPRGVRSVGGAAGVDAANSGSMGGGMGQPIIMLDGEVMGAAATRSARSHRGFGRELDRRAGTLPGVRGRY